MIDFVKKIFTKRNRAFLFINIGNIPVMAFVSAFLAVYYINVLGMDEYSVGTLFLVARIFDGINDPVIGYCIDRIKKKRIEKFKTSLKTGVILCIVNYLILWIGPALTSGMTRLIVAWTAYLVLGITFPIMDISLNSLLPVLTYDRSDRDILSSIKIIGYGVGTLLIDMGVPIVLTILGASVPTYTMLVLGISSFIAGFSFVGCAGLKGDSMETDYNSHSYADSYKFRDLRSILTVRNIWIIFLSGICFYTGTAILTVSNTYFTMYYFGHVGLLTLVTVATYSLEFFVIILLPAFSRKFGRKTLFSVGLILAGSGVLIRLLPLGTGNVGIFALLASSAVFGIGYGFTMILFYSLQADNADEIYRVSGKRAEGMVAAFMSMVNKFGKGIGGALPLYILGFMKLGNGRYSTFGLKIVDGVLPAFLFIMGGFLFWINYKEKK